MKARPDTLVDQTEDQQGKHSWRPGILAANDSMVQIRPLYLARDDAAAFLSLSTSQFEAMVSRGIIPAPRLLSGRRTGWLVDELEAWGRDRPVSELLPPKNSGRGRAGNPS